MSRMQVTSCDGCNEIAPADYSPSFPRHGWMHVTNSSVSDELDVCSWACLATLVAAKMADEALT